MDLVEEKCSSLVSHVPPELPKAINVYLVYLDQTQYIEKTKKYYFPLNSETIGLDTLRQIIQSGELFEGNGAEPRQFQFEELFICNVSLDPSNLQVFLQNQAFQDHFRESYVRVVGAESLADITLQPSLFIFHEINSIVLFFKEEKTQPAEPAKPILTPPTAPQEKKAKTKRVNFSAHQSIANAAVTRKKRIQIQRQY